MQDSVSQVQSIDLDGKAEPDPADVFCFHFNVDLRIQRGPTQSKWELSPSQET